MSLNRNEWPEEIINLMSDDIISVAQRVREACGTAMVPSPVPQAHARFIDGSSMHCVGVDGTKKSQATDLFVLNNLASSKVWELAQSVDGVGGFGMYFDSYLAGEKTTLIHIDNRDNRLLWICPNETKRRYVYYNNNPIYFLDLLSKELAKL
mgnify:FL=1